MKKLFFTASLIFAIIQVHSTNNYTINELWYFLKDSTIKDVNQLPAALKNAKQIDLPHTWNINDIVDENEGFYRGIGWYAKKVRIPSNYATKDVLLFFEGVGQVADVYINKKHAYQHIGGYTRFVVPVSDLINFDSKNEFSYFDVYVKVDNSFNEDVPTLTADFTFFGGIYRDVNLVVKDKVHFDMESFASNAVYLTTPTVSEQAANVNVKFRVRNNETSTRKIKCISKVYDANGNLVVEDKRTFKIEAGKVSEFKFDLKTITNPTLWSIENPYLYNVTSQLYDEKTNVLLDEVTNPLGLRYFSFDKDKGFFLNGKHVKLVGTNRHQDFEGLGNALPDYIHVSDIVKMKEMGSNFLRIAHYPQDQAILNMCDRLGILTCVEVPIVNTVTESEAFSKNCLRTHEEMMHQNYNHPSLIIWAYMNEVLLHPKYAKDKIKHSNYLEFVRVLAQKIEDLTRKEDPFRYTMIPNHGNLELYYNAGLTSIPMIVGWNIYHGWYRYSVNLLEEDITRIFKAINKPMMITEYGADCDTRLRAINPKRFDYSMEYSLFFHEHYYKVFEKLPFIAAALVWNYADFNSEQRSDANQSMNNKGLMDWKRKPKDTYYFYQAALLKEPFVAINTKAWYKRSCVEDSLTPGMATMPVTVFSNQPEIELFQNGKSLGTKKIVDYKAVWNVPFVNGENKFVAKNNAAQVEDNSIVEINVLPIKLSKFPETGLSINVGDERFFYDKTTNQSWVNDKKYTPGSWGYVGGEPFVMKNTTKQPYGTNNIIAGTPCDPLYQTQRVGINQYRFDVEPGVYDVALHFAELEGKKGKSLIYELSDDVSNTATTMNSKNRTFSVLINNNLVLNKLSIVEQYGEYTAVKFKSKVTVKKGESLIIDFKSETGAPVLNAIELYKAL